MARYEYSDVSFDSQCRHRFVFSICQCRVWLEISYPCAEGDSVDLQLLGGRLVACYIIVEQEGSSGTEES